MAIPRISAKFETTLSLRVNIGDETATLTSVTDADGVSLPNGTYGLTIDEGNSDFEYIEATLTGTALTNIKSFSATALTETTGFTKEHRSGAEVKITDFTILGRLSRIFRGEEEMDGSSPLTYDSAPTLSDPDSLATVQYVLDNITGGTVTFNANIIAGVAGEGLTAGDWVYLKESDGRWYQTDANATESSVDVKIGKALGTTTTGNTIGGGVFIGGIETSGTYVAGTKYYLSNTAGELSTSAGENEVLVGIGDANTNLIFVNLYDPESVSQGEKDALVGTLGTPSSTNKYVTDSNASEYGSDQSQTTDDGSIEFGESDGATKKVSIAQSFQPVKNKIRGVRLKKKADTGDFSGSVTVAIQEDDGSGNPDGVDLVTITLTDEFNLKAEDNTVDFEFASEYTMDTTKTYWIEIVSSTSSDTDHPNIAVNSAGGYADGSLKYYNTTDGWTAVSGQDLYFETLEGVKNQLVKSNSDGLIPQKFLDWDNFPPLLKFQQINFYDTDEMSSKTTMTSTTNGDLMFFSSTTSDTSGNLYRYERNKFGEYKETHRVTATRSGANTPNNQYEHLVVIGDYVYHVWCDSSSEVQVTRYDIADLTNATTMTVPTISFSAVGIHVWTDGTFIYINPENDSTTSRYSISGTTISLDDTGSASNALKDQDDGGSILFNGENHYFVYGSSNNVVVLKFNDVYGSSITTTSYSYRDFPPTVYVGTSNVANQRYSGFVGDDGHMYICYMGIISESGSNYTYGITMYVLENL